MPVFQISGMEKYSSCFDILNTCIKPPKIVHTVAHFFLPALYPDPNTRHVHRAVHIRALLERGERGSVVNTRTHYRCICAEACERFAHKNSPVCAKLPQWHTQHHSGLDR